MRFRLDRVQRLAALGNKVCNCSSCISGFLVRLGAVNLSANYLLFFK